MKSIRGELNGLAGFRDMLGHAPAFLKMLDISARVAGRQTPILIIGESGTGKDLLARAIHENSAVRNGPFVRMTCGLPGSDPAKLISSSRKSHTPGTLYLDEVTQLPPQLQMELEHVLHESEGDKTMRLISSSSVHGDLVGQAKLRPDLYYRVSVVPIHVPPLRERKEDLPELSHFFAGRLANRHNLSVTPIPEAVHQRLAQHRWPGNVRELESVLERMILLAADFEFSGQDLTMEGSEEPAAAATQLSRGLPETGLSLAQIERDLLAAALAKFGGNQTKAARYLNISRRTLIYRMGKYNLRPVESAGER